MTAGGDSADRSRPLRVLLVNPPPFEIVEPWYDAPSFGRHGLACIAGYLRAFDGFDVHIIDAKLERLDFEQLVARIRALRPDVVGVTAFTNEIRPAGRVAELVKRALPDAITVIGGIHVTALPERTMREFPAFDIGCIGEGEITFHELCTSLRDGEPLDRVLGIIYRDRDGLRRTGDRPKLDDLDRLPLPAWDLLPRADEYWLMTQRGCPFTCGFCVNPNGRLPRQHSIPRVMAEIEAIVGRYRPRKLWFADEIFSIHVGRTHDLLDAMIAARVGERTSFWAETHVGFVDEPLLAKMKRAGCSECALGIETGDEAALRGLGKGTNVSRIVDAFEAARRARIDTVGFFILGHPNESGASIRRTIDLAVRLNPTIPIFGVMVPYPGTEVGRLAARGEGGYRLLTDDWDAFNKQVGGALAFAGLSRRQIEALQLRAYVEVFTANRRFLDLAKFVWRYRTAGTRLLQRALWPGEPEPRPVSAESLAELAAAAESWAGTQVNSVRQLRKSGAQLVATVSRGPARERRGAPAPTPRQ